MIKITNLRPRNLDNFKEMFTINHIGTKFKILVKLGDYHHLLKLTFRTQVTFKNVGGTAHTHTIYIYIYIKG